MRDFAKFNPEYFEMEPVMNVEQTASKPGLLHRIAKRLILGPDEKPKGGKAKAKKADPEDDDLIAAKVHKMEITRAARAEFLKRVAADNAPHEATPEQKAVAQRRKAETAAAEKARIQAHMDDFDAKRKAAEAKRPRMKKGGVPKGEKPFSDILSGKSMQECVALIGLSQSSGIPYPILEQVFDRGLKSWHEGCKHSMSELGFARVDRFITEGANNKLDIDLLKPE
jgi:hypothetical protein